MYQPGEKDRGGVAATSSPLDGCGGNFVWWQGRKFASKIKQRVLGSRYLASPEVVAENDRLLTNAWQKVVVSFMETLKEDDLSSSYYIDRDFEAHSESKPSLQALHEGCIGMLSALVSRAQKLLVSRGHSMCHYQSLPLDYLAPKEAAAVRLILHLCDLEEYYHHFLRLLTRRLERDLGVAASTSDARLVDWSLLNEESCVLLRGLRFFIQQDNFEPIWQGWDLVKTAFDLLDGVLVREDDGVTKGYDREGEEDSEATQNAKVMPKATI